MTNLVHWCFAGEKELRADDVSNAVAYKQHRAHYTPLREPGHVGRDQTEGDGNIHRKNDCEHKARHAPGLAIKAIHEHHPDHRNCRVEDH